MFENAKVGDRVWDFVLGWGTIEEMDYGNSPYVITVKFDSGHLVDYMLDGSEFENSMPTLFWNEIKFEVPEKPLNLINFLKENLKPKNFKVEYDNCFIYCNFSRELSKFIYHWGVDLNDIVIGVTYFNFDNLDKVVAELTNRNIEPGELQEAFKELGWL